MKVNNHNFNKERNASFISAFLMMFIISIYFVHIPWNIDRLDISESELGFGLFVFGISNFFSNQISGRIIVPKFGTSNTVILGLVIFCFCPLLLISVPNYNFFVISWIPFGIAIGCMVPTLNTQISIVETKTDKIILPIFQASYSTGSLFGSIAAAYFISYISDPRITFFFLGTIIFVYVFIFKIFGLKREYEPEKEIVKFKLPKKIILIYGFLMMMNFATIGIILDWTPVWLTRDLSAPLFLGGILLIFFSIGEIVARLMGSRLLNSLGTYIVGGYFSILSGIVLFLSVLTMNLYFIIFGMLLFGFGTANFIAIVIREAIRISDESINITVSNLITLGFSGFIFGPVAVGYLAEYFGLTFNMYLLSIIWGGNGIALLYLMNINKSKIN